MFSRLAVGTLAFQVTVIYAYTSGQSFFPPKPSTKFKCERHLVVLWYMAGSTSSISTRFSFISSNTLCARDVLSYALLAGVAAVRLRRASWDEPTCISARSNKLVSLVVFLVFPNIQQLVMAALHGPWVLPRMSSRSVFCRVRDSRDA